jgi:hypothetical protein
VPSIFYYHASGSVFCCKNHYEVDKNRFCAVITGRINRPSIATRMWFMIAMVVGDRMLAARKRAKQSEVD